MRQIVQLTNFNTKTNFPLLDDSYYVDTKKKKLPQFSDAYVLLSDDYLYS